MQQEVVVTKYSPWKADTPKYIFAFNWGGCKLRSSGTDLG